MYKKIIAGLLLLVMILSLIGCGSEKRQPIHLTLSTEDAAAILAAAGILLPDVEEAVGANSTVQWFSWFDDFHNYSEAEVVNTGYFTFTEKYNCEVEWIECTWNERFTRVANLMLGGTPPDFMNAETENFPYYAIQGTFQPINPYIDLEDPLWSGIADYMRTYFSLGDNVYLLCTDRGFGGVMAYNRRVFEEWGYEDPAQLFYNNEWTWDVFYDMCLDFSDPDNDRYALDGWFYARALIRSCGVPVVSYDVDSEQFVSNIDDPRLERVNNNLLAELNKNDCIWPAYQYGNRVRNQGASAAGDFGDGLKEGLLLFSIGGGTYFITGPVDEIAADYGDITENEVMFVPAPRDPEGDGNTYIESDPHGYCIVSGARNPEGVALLAMCDRFKVIDPTVVSIDRYQLQYKYYWTDEMLDMYDVCDELANTGDIIVCYDEQGLGTTLGDIVRTIEHTIMQQNVSSWSQIKEGYSDQLDYYIGELNESLLKYK